MTNWQTDIIPKWLEEAKTYPTKALLYMAGEIYVEQARRLETEKGKLDGMMWSPEQWNKI